MRSLLLGVLPSGADESHQAKTCQHHGVGSWFGNSSWLEAHLTARTATEYAHEATGEVGGVRANLQSKAGSPWQQL